MRKKIFNNIRQVAKSSTYRNKHGAALVHGSKILKEACNINRPVGFAHKFHFVGLATKHAEIGVILNMKKERTKGCDIYVCRVGANGKFSNSKPCDMCIAVCKKMGIRKIYYTISERKFGCLKLHEH